MTGLALDGAPSGARAGGGDDTPGVPPHHHGHGGLASIAGSNVNLRTVEQMAAAMSQLQDRRAVYSIGGPTAIPLDDRLRDLTRDIALHFCLPRTSLTPLLHQGLLSAQEVAYAYVSWKFVYTFASRMTQEFASLTAIIKNAPTGEPAGGAAATAQEARFARHHLPAGVSLLDPPHTYARHPLSLPAVSHEALALLSKLRKALAASSFTETQILDAIFRYPDQVRRSLPPDAPPPARAWEHTPCVTLVPSPPRPL